MTTLGSRGIEVAASADIEEGGRLVLSVLGTEIGIFRVEGNLYAYQNLCPHAGGPVCQGTLLPAVEEVLDDRGRSVGQRWNDDDPRIVCPWHGYEYSLKTGRFPNVPRLALRSFPVSELDGVVYVDV